MFAWTFALAVGLGDATTVVFVLALELVLFAVLQAPATSKLKRVKHPTNLRISSSSC